MSTTTPSEAVQLINPYWDEIKDRVGIDPLWGDGLTVSWLGFDYHTRHFDVTRRLDRKAFCSKYAWAVPDPKAVQFVAGWLGPRAVEMGAGMGYWAWMLSQAGVDIIAYDSAPPDTVCTNRWHSPREEQTYHFANQPIATYYPVQRAEPSILKEHPDRTLFLCWPPYNESMAAECLDAYQGLRLVFIGEDKGGCTGDDAFFERLEASWREVASHRLVQWDAIHDWVRVFERGASA